MLQIESNRYGTAHADRYASVEAGLDTPMRRIGNALPGLCTWGILVACVLGVAVFPAQWLKVVLCFLGYLVLQMTWQIVFMLVGEWRIAKWKARDWTKGEKRRNPATGIAPADVRHVVLIPNYKEPYEVLAETLEALAVQHRAWERIIPVLAMEAREAGAEAKAERLVRAFSGRFLHVGIALHPAGIPGELAGKSSNQAWAGRRAREIVDDLGLDPDLVTISSCDSDSIFHPSYFAAISKLFASDTRRHHRFWQAPLHYYNNIRTVPWLLRLDLVFKHTDQLAGLAMPGFSPLPISTYTASLRLIEKSGWWDAGIVPEDWHMYLRAYFAMRGEVSTVGVYLPTWGDIVDGATTVAALKARYTQIVRHNWGAEDAGYVLVKMLRGGAPWFRTSLLFGHVLYDHVLRGIIWAVLTSGTIIGWQVAWTHDVMLLWNWWQYSPWLRLLYAASTVVFLAMLVAEMFRRAPAGASKTTLVVETLGAWLLIPLVGAFSGLAPALHAQTMLMLGMSLQYKVAPKRIAASATA
jgi:hypothetical protein